MVTLVDGYIVILLYCLGLKPVLEKCVICGKSYHNIVKDQLNQQVPGSPPASNREASRAGRFQVPGLYFSGGGLICPICLIQKQKIGEEITACGLKEVSVLQLLLTGNWLKIAACELSEKEQIAAHRLVLEYARYHSERPVGDWLSLAARALA